MAGHTSPRTLLLLGLLGQAVAASVDAAYGEQTVVRVVYVLPFLALAPLAPAATVAWVAACGAAVAVASALWNDDFGEPSFVIGSLSVALAGVITVLSVRTREQALALRGATEAAERRLSSILGALAEAVTVADADGKIIYANRAAAELLGAASPEELMSAAPGSVAAKFQMFHEDGSPLRPEDLPGRRVLRGESGASLRMRTISPEGGVNWFVLRASRLETPEGAFAVNVFENVTDRREAELRQQFLADAGQLLASSLDYEKTLQQVADLAVQELADWAGIEVPDDRDGMRQVAVAHINPEKVALARELRERWPPDYDAPTSTRSILRAQQPLFIPEIPFEMVEAAAQDEEHLAVIRELGLVSAMSVPMVLRGRGLGVITFVTAESGRIYTEQDLQLATALADRAASALDNARLYSEIARIAETLQQSLLPEVLPDVAGWEVAADYRAGEVGSEVGGDFYDVLPIEDGHLALLGDVSGKGVAAAALTSLVRHTAKTGALFDAHPAAVLALVNRVLRDQPSLSPVTMATASCSSEGRVALAIGGHPLPILKRADGPAERVGHPGLLLGVVDEYPASPAAELDLERGDVLLMFTDGVTDTPGAGGRFGEARLREVVARAPSDPVGLLRAIADALTEFQEGSVVDDRALLALRYCG